METAAADDYKFNLGDNLFATVSLFRGYLNIGFRVYKAFTDDGEQLYPGFPGISLSAKQYETFSAKIDVLMEEWNRGSPTPGFVNTVDLENGKFLEITRRSPPVAPSIVIYKRQGDPDNDRVPMTWAQVVVWHEHRESINKAVEQLRPRVVAKPKNRVKFDLGEDWYATVGTFNNRVLVGVRKFVFDKFLKADFPGVALSPEAFEEMVTLLEKRCPCEHVIGYNHRVALTPLGLTVDKLRTETPSKSRVVLNVQSACALFNVFDDIRKAVAEMKLTLPEKPLTRLQTAARALPKVFASSQDGEEDWMSQAPKRRKTESCDKLEWLGGDAEDEEDVTKMFRFDSNDSIVSVE
jgi:Transcriptional Coactivator p15 (PC4)